jgi:mitofusin
MFIALPVFLEQMSGLLPAEKKQVLLNVLPRREPFEVLYRLNCDEIFADFQVGMEFRVSSGLSGIDSTNYPKQASMLYIIVSVTGNGHI